MKVSKNKAAMKNTKRGISQVKNGSVRSENVKEGKKDNFLVVCTHFITYCYDDVGCKDYTTTTKTTIIRIMQFFALTIKKLKCTAHKL